MRSIIATAFALIVSIGYLSAQDVIICRNGDEITSKVLKISKTEIEYKKWNNQDGPTYTLEKAEVFMIKYQNGDKDVFKETPAAPAQASNEQATNSNEQTAEAPSEPILATPATNNAELIASYNNYNINEVLKSYYEINKIKNNNVVLNTLAITSSSILSTDEIEISIKPIMNTCGEFDIYGQNTGDIIGRSPYFYGFWKYYKYAIIIKNKTSRIMYIDKASCFGTSSKGNNKTFFDPQEYIVTEGGDSGNSATVNLGSVANALGVGGAVGTLANGVTVGGDKGTFSAMTTTYKDNRILTIPPQGTTVLSEDGAKEHPTKRKKYIVTGSYEIIFCEGRTLVSKTSPIKEFTEENSPETRNYMITYSFDNNLHKCTMVNFGVYVKNFVLLNKKNAIETISSINNNSPKVIFSGTHAK